MSFKNAIIILTSNLGSQEIYQHTIKRDAEQGGAAPQQLSEAAKQGMRDVVMAKVGGPGWAHWCSVCRGGVWGVAVAKGCVGGSTMCAGEQAGFMLMLHVSASVMCSGGDWAQQHRDLHSMHPLCHTTSSMQACAPAPGLTCCPPAAQVRKHFTPEFINRIDEFIIFEPLAKTHIRKIVRLRLKGVEARIADKKMKLQVRGWAWGARGRRMGVAGLN